MEATTPTLAAAARRGLSAPALILTGNPTELPSPHASKLAQVPAQVIDDIATVQANVRNFATEQRESITDFEVGTLPGFFPGQKNIPIQAVCARIPGGRHPLTASAHMTLVTAEVAGVRGSRPVRHPFAVRSRRPRWPRCPWPGRELPARRRSGHRGCYRRQRNYGKGQPARRSHLVCDK